MLTRKVLSPQFNLITFTPPFGEIARPYSIKLTHSLATGMLAA